MNSGCQQINEQWYIQSMEYLALKKKDDKTTRRHGRTLDAYNYAKQTNPRKARDCVISTIWHSGKGKSMETIKRWVVASGSGDREEGWESQAQRIWWAVRTLNILQWWIYVIIHLSKPIEYTIPRVNLKVIYDIWMNVMYRSILDPKKSYDSEELCC